MKLYCNESTYTAYSKEIVEQAQNRPMERERIVSQIEKLGNTPFVFETLDIKMDEAIFLSIKTLNDLRRGKRIVRGTIGEILQKNNR